VRARPNDVRRLAHRLSGTEARANRPGCSAALGRHAHRRVRVRALTARLGRACEAGYRLSRSEGAGRAPPARGGSRQAKGQPNVAGQPPVAAQPCTGGPSQAHRASPPSPRWEATSTRPARRSPTERRRKKGVPSASLIARDPRRGVVLLPLCHVCCQPTRPTCGAGRSGRSGGRTRSQNYRPRPSSSHR
jgi:hypothetical protein